MNLEDLVLAGVSFIRAMFIPPARGLESWVHNIAGVSILVLGLTRYFFGV